MLYKEVVLHRYSLVSNNMVYKRNTGYIKPPVRKCDIENDLCDLIMQKCIIIRYLIFSVVLL